MNTNPPNLPGHSPKDSETGAIRLLKPTHILRPALQFNPVLGTQPITSPFPQNSRDFLPRPLVRKSPETPPTDPKKKKKVSSTNTEITLQGPNDLTYRMPNIQSQRIIILRIKIDGEISLVDSQ
jgi:hypothetical protein